MSRAFSVSKWFGFMNTDFTPNGIFVRVGVDILACLFILKFLLVKFTKAFYESHRIATLIYLFFKQYGMYLNEKVVCTYVNTQVPGPLEIL